jgi:hypothetical protein
MLNRPKKFDMFSGVNYNTTFQHKHCNQSGTIFISKGSVLTIKGLSKMLATKKVYYTLRDV